MHPRGSPLWGVMMGAVGLTFSIVAVVIHPSPFARLLAFDTLMRGTTTSRNHWRTNAS